MVPTSIHNPDRYIADLRQILSQGRKRVGLLIGAGAGAATRVDANNRIDLEGGIPLVPDVARLTEVVLSHLTDCDRAVISAIKGDVQAPVNIESIKGDAQAPVNIESILSQVRRLGQAIGKSEVHGLNGDGYDALGERICTEIGRHVSAKLPDGGNPYSDLVAWIAGIQREHSIELFTPNYDLLIEEAFERARVPFFDGFTGAHKPFFDPASISADVLPSRWTLLWKLHGSLGWEFSDETVVRTGTRDATELIYPDHLKYERVTKLPYSALFDRLRQFLTTSDTLLICTGFSFLDSHICAVLDEALAANSHTAVFGFQFNSINEEQAAARLAFGRPNMSVLARDGAVINGVQGKWRPGIASSVDWDAIRETYWQRETEEVGGHFLLGDFANLTRFLALTRAHLDPPIEEISRPKIEIAGKDPDGEFELVN